MRQLPRNGSRRRPAGEFVDHLDDGTPISQGILSGADRSELVWVAGAEGKPRWVRNPGLPSVPAPATSDRQLCSPAAEVDFTGIALFLAAGNLNANRGLSRRH